MLTSTIAYLRNKIKTHPDFAQWAPKITGNYTIDNCSPKTLAWLAKQMDIPFTDHDKRGRPRKNPYAPNPIYNEPMTPSVIHAPYEPIQKEEPTPMQQPTMPQQEEPKPVYTNGHSIESIIEGIVKRTLANYPQALDETKILSLIAAHGSKTIEKPLHITLNNSSSLSPVIIPDGTYHYAMPLILSAINAGVNVLLVGPAGSGKTTLADQLATILGHEFYMTGAVSSEYKLSGFIDAQGRIISTAFRAAYENGGVFLFDELDASQAAAVLAFNAALANGHADFPNPNGGSLPIKRHPNFRAIAAANTYGRGQNRVYIGRNQLDGASLDRFITVDFNYDEYLEAQIIGVTIPNKNPSFNIQPRDVSTTEKETILNIVHKAREAFEGLRLEMVCSPRATMAYVKLYAAGWPTDQIAAAVIFKGMVTETKEKVLAFNGHALSHALLRLA